MKYTVEKSEKYTTLTLNEEKLDTLMAPKLKSEFVTLFQSGASNLILDLSEVKYIDSSGLSALLVANRMSKEAEGLMVVVGLTEHVNKLVKISKLDTIFSILPTREEAVDAIFLHEIEKDLNTDEATESNL